MATYQRRFSFYKGTPKMHQQYVWYYSSSFEDVSVGKFTRAEKKQPSINSMCIDIFVASV